MTVSEELILQYRTETDVDEALLKKALWGSVTNSWRKGFYIVIGVVYVVQLGLFAWLGTLNGNYGVLIKWALIFLAAAGFVYFTLHMSVQTSLRRWKEQNHVAVLHMFGGFNEEGFVFGQDDKHSVLHYADLYKIFAVGGVWVLRTKAGLLVFYNAAQLEETDRESVLALVKQKNPKVKIRLPKRK